MRSCSSLHPIPAFRDRPGSSLLTQGRSDRDESPDEPISIGDSSRSFCPPPRHGLRPDSHDTRRGLVDLASWPASHAPWAQIDGPGLDFGPNPSRVLESYCVGVGREAERVAGSPVAESGPVAGELRHVRQAPSEPVGNAQAIAVLSGGSPGPGCGARQALESATGPRSCTCM